MLLLPDQNLPYRSSNTRLEDALDFDIHGLEVITGSKYSRRQHKSVWFSSLFNPHNRPEGLVVGLMKAFQALLKRFRDLHLEYARSTSRSLS